MSLQRFLYLIASFLAVVVVLTLHEFAHAFVAYKCGDPTPKWNKRLTLNPVRHFDIMGLLCFTFVGFGWAKPVPVNPNNFRKYRLGSGLTASAGVIVNYISALIFFPFFILLVQYGTSAIPQYLYYFLYSFVLLLYSYSLSFCVFNLLPLYPLDGFRIVEACSRKHGKIYRFLRKYGHIILLFLIIESFICGIFVDFGVYQMAWFNILGYIMQFARKYIGFPIVALWSVIFGRPISSIWGMLF